MSVVATFESQSSWAQSVQLRGQDLRGADLRGADLTGARLDGALLDGADLRGAVLARASAVAASFARARLASATVLRSTMTRASFDDADLSDVVFGGSDFDGATLRHATVARTQFSSCRLHCATLAGAVVDGMRLVDCHGFGLTVAGAVGTAPLVSGCDFRGAVLHDREPGGVSFPAARWEGVDLRFARPGMEPLHPSSPPRSGAGIAPGGCLIGVRLDASLLAGADFSGVAFADVSARWADLRRADFVAAYIHDLDLTRTVHAGAELALTRGGPPAGLDAPATVEEARPRHERGLALIGSTGDSHRFWESAPGGHELAPITPLGGVAEQRRGE